MILYYPTSNRLNKQKNLQNTFKTNCKVNDIGSHNVLQVILSNFNLPSQNTLTELTLEMVSHLRA